MKAEIVESPEAEKPKRVNLLGAPIEDDDDITPLAPVAVTKVAEPDELDGLTMADIFNPKPYSYKYGPLTIKIPPMQDSQLMEVSEDMDAVVGLLQEALADTEGEGINIAAMVSALPTLFKTALPKVSRILAESLSKTEEEIARVPLAHKIGLFRGVLEAENIPLLLKNGGGLLSSLSPESATPAKTEDAKTTDLG